jgi:cytochrome c-type biogenesis protein CcmE
LKKQRKFLLAATLVIGMVGYLMVTGMRDSMEFYLTPAEVLSRVAVDPTIHDMGIRVGGRVAPGTVSYDARTLNLTFHVVDIETALAGSESPAAFPVSFQGPLPETFEEGVDVVISGRFTAAGVFQATEVLTKCGSRYEAGIEDYLS